VRCGAKKRSKSLPDIHLTLSLETPLTFLFDLIGACFGVIQDHQLQIRLEREVAEAPKNEKGKKKKKGFVRLAVRNSGLLAEQIDEGEVLFFTNFARLSSRFRIDVAEKSVRFVSNCTGGHIARVLLRLEAETEMEEPDIAFLLEKIRQVFVTDNPERILGPMLAAFGALLPGESIRFEHFEEEDVSITQRMSTMGIARGFETDDDEEEVKRETPSSAPERLVALGSSPSIETRERRRRRRQRRREARQGYLDFDDEENDGVFEEVFDMDFGRSIIMQLEPQGASEMLTRRLPEQILSFEDCILLGKCSVCQMEYNQSEVVLRLPCLHAFHKGCILQWLKQSKQCPEDRLQNRR